MSTTAQSAASPAASPLVQGFLGQLAFIRRETAALTDGIGASRFNWVPAPGRWSAGQVIEHLNLTGRDYLNRITPLLEAARAKGLRDRGDYKPTLIGGLMVRSMEPPPRRRFKAPKMWQPAGAGPALDPAAELARLHALHDALDAQLRAADGLDLRRIKLASPVSPLIRMNAGDALNLVLTHERRHLYQLRQITEEAGYPPVA
jgi:hypothetical protein